MGQLLKNYSFQAHIWLNLGERLIRLDYNSAFQGTSCDLREIPNRQYKDLEKYLGTKNPYRYKRIFLIGRCLIAGFSVFGMDSGHHAMPSAFDSSNIRHIQL